MSKTELAKRLRDEAETIRHGIDDVNEHAVRRLYLEAADRIGELERALISVGNGTIELERELKQARARIAELEKDAQNVTVELDAMNANFQGMLKDRNAWRDKARELEKDAARYQRLKARDFCIDKEITAANADATIDAHMNDA